MKDCTALNMREPSAHSGGILSVLRHSRHSCYQCQLHFRMVFLFNPPVCLSYSHLRIFLYCRTTSAQQSYSPCSNLFSTSQNICCVYFLSTSNNQTILMYELGKLYISFNLVSNQTHSVWTIHTVLSLNTVHWYVFITIANTLLNKKIQSKYASIFNIVVKFSIHASLFYIFTT